MAKAELIVSTDSPSLTDPLLIAYRNIICAIIERELTKSGNEQLSFDYRHQEGYSDFIVTGDMYALGDLCRDLFNKGIRGLTVFVESEGHFSFFSNWGMLPEVTDL